jgi:tetratricopeptide (TPR) repeat protein
MDTEPRTGSRFVPDRLPWIIAGVALVLYLATLNRWVRIESVTMVAKMTGWDVAPLVYAPLLYLVCLPVRWLPAGLQPATLNVLTALMAALTLALLARSVALLPFDRTRETRMRASSQPAFSALAGFPMGWVPAVLAVTLCGLQASFWEHATAVTGEMLDLLLFAFFVHEILAYRTDPRDGRLLRFALIYGLATAQNFAMIAFFPCFLIAVIRLKSWEFLQLGFIGRMLVAGILGLLLYLLLPLVGVPGGSGTLTFWEHLRAVLGSQREALKSLPPYVILLLSFTSLLPVLLISIRWAPASGETSAAGESLTVLLLWAIQGLLLVACASVFFDPRWSPRALGFGMPLLPFYYLAALSVGYFVGYFLVLAQRPRGRSSSSSPGLLSQLGPAVLGLVLLALALSAGALLRRNYPRLRVMDGRLLGGLADRMVASLPDRGPVYVVGDTAADLMLLEARLRSQRSVPLPVLVHSRSLEFTRYHQSLARRYPQRWPQLPDLDRLPQPIDNTLILDMLTDLVRSNRACYLNPSFGYFFEGLQAVPRGLAYDLRPLPKTPVEPPRLTLAELEPARRFWDAQFGVLAQIPAPSRDRPVFEQWYVAQFYSRALNHWGVTLQRAGDVAAAEKPFQLAIQINPENAVAHTNLAFNTRLRQNAAPPADLSKTLDLPAGYRTPDALLLANGPLDDPQWTMTVGQVFAQGTLFRQALVEFDRTLALVPGSATALLWRQNMEIMSRFRLGDLAGAEQEALALQARYPKDENAVEALTQIYLLSGRPTNALATVERQLQINPDNGRALLNKSGLCIQLGRFAEAIPPLDKLLARQPGHQAALQNRAIAYLQNGQLDPASQDYAALAKAMPDSAPVDYGLGEIAYRRKDAASAILHYEAYLKHGTKGTDEYKEVQQRLDALRRGEKPH